MCPIIAGKVVSSDYTSEHSPRVRLWVHRVKKFLFGLSKFINNVPSTILREAINEAVPLVLDLIPKKLRLGVSLYDLSLAVFWRKLIDYGVTEVSIIKLIRIAKSNLNHKVTHGKILKILSFLKDIDNYADTNSKIYLYVRLFVNKLFEAVKNRRVEFDDFKIPNVKRTLVLISRRIIEEVSGGVLLGGSPKVLAAAILYVAIKLCNHLLPINVSSSIIEDIAGVNRFTILRRYKQVINILEKSIENPQIVCFLDSDG